MAWSDGRYSANAYRVPRRGAPASPKASLHTVGAEGAEGAGARLRLRDLCWLGPARRPKQPRARPGRGSEWPGVRPTSTASHAHKSRLDRPPSRPQVHVALSLPASLPAQLNHLAGKLAQRRSEHKTPADGPWMRPPAFSSTLLPHSSCHDSRLTTHDGRLTPRSASTTSYCLTSCVPCESGRRSNGTADGLSTQPALPKPSPPPRHGIIIRRAQNCAACDSTCASTWSPTPEQAYRILEACPYAVSY